MKIALRGLQDEEQRLLEQLREIPAFRQLEAIRAVLAIYTSQQEGVARVRPSNRDIEQGAIAYLRDIGRRATSSEILRALQERGFDFPGDKPHTAVSAALSRSSLFDNVRGEGYGLVEQKPAASKLEPPPAPEEAREAA